MSNCFATDQLILNGMNIIAKFMPTLHMSQHSDIFHKSQFTPKKRVHIITFLQCFSGRNLQKCNFKKIPV